MPAVPVDVLDRRVYPRIAVNGAVKYRLQPEAEFSDGLMIDISQTGLLIRLDKPLHVDTLVYLRMEADQTNDNPIEITAEIVRIADSDLPDQFCYGCMILDVREM